MSTFAAAFLTDTLKHKTCACISEESQSPELSPVTRVESPIIIFQTKIDMVLITMLALLHVIVVSVQQIHGTVWAFLHMTTAVSFWAKMTRLDSSFIVFYMTLNAWLRCQNSTVM